MHKLTKAEIMREVKDYIYITLGLISYSLGWAAFLLPYQITTGGTTGIGAIIYYATGFPLQWSYFIINAVLMTFAIRVLGPKFSALVIPVGGEQLRRSTGYDAGRQAAIAWYRTGLHGLYYRCSHVWCRPRYHFQLQWKYGRNRYYRGHRQ